RWQGPAHAGPGGRTWVRVGGGRGRLAGRRAGDRPGQLRASRRDEGPAAAGRRLLRDRSRPPGGLVEMSAAALAIRHGRALLFISAAAAAGGIWAAAAMPKGVYPEVKFPREQVVAELAGAPAATVLAGLTRPLEASLASVPGVEQVRSKTIRGTV